MTTLAQKKAFNTWRGKNPEKWREYCRKTSSTFYETHKEEKKQKTLGRYYFNKEAEIFRNILISQ
jgi:hypothetical protein